MRIADLVRLIEGQAVIGNRRSQSGAMPAARCTRQQAIPRRGAHFALFATVLVGLLASLIVSSQTRAAQGPDVIAPTKVSSLGVTSSTQTTISVRWLTSTDNVGVAGYEVFRSHVRVAVVTSTSFTYTFGSLSCGKSYMLGVRAYDAAGNRSVVAWISAKTSPCGGGAPPTAQGPTAPTSLAVSVTATSLTLSWSASSDDVGVAGYDVFVNGSKVATVTGTSVSLAGLTCNSNYTLGVEAFDAAGNRSPRSTTVTRTAACTGPTPPTGGGNLYIAPNGSDSGQCTQSAPCASFSRAYQLAKPGDVVQVAGGSYPAQMLPYDATKTSSADVVFQPTSGASVSLAGFIAGKDATGTGAKHFELRDMRIAGELQLRSGTDDVVLRNIDGDSFNLTSTRNVQVLGGDWGPKVDNVSHIKGGAENIIIDGAYFHDYTISNPAKHAECVHIWGAKNVTIRNSLFERCTDFDIFAKREGGAVLDGLLIENNMLDAPMPGATATVQCVPGCPRGGNAIRFSAGGGPIANAVARYNSALGGIGTDGQSITVKANAMAAADFLDPVTTDGTMDLHLKAGASAIGAGDPADFPSRDWDGQSRPQGLPDAGADERT